MVLLFKKLQAQNAYFYGLQQLLLFHRYEEFKLQISLLSLEALSIPISNQLLLKQSKYSYKCFVEVFIEKL